MITPPEIIDAQAELIAEALDGVAFQACHAARFYARGDHDAGRAAYERLRDLCNAHVSPAVKVIEEAAVQRRAIGEAAVEFRKSRKKDAA